MSLMLKSEHKFMGTTTFTGIALNASTLETIGFVPNQNVTTALGTAAQRITGSGMVMKMSKVNTLDAVAMVVDAYHEEVGADVELMPGETIFGKF